MESLNFPENPKQLWETFREDLAEDFIREAKRSDGNVEEAIKRANRAIAYKLYTKETKERNFRYWVQRFGMDDTDDYENDPNQQFLNFESLAIGEEMYELLKGKQVELVNTILSSVAKENLGQNAFSLMDLEARGKTFIYKTLFHILRGGGYNFGWDNLYLFQLNHTDVLRF